jgi:molybdopterin synthase catalytic subunit
MRIALVDRPIDVAALIREASDESCGASSTFLGTVRDVNDGRPVTGIEYSAYRSMAEREMTAIAEEAAEQFGVTRLVVEHRLGTLTLEDVSIAVVAAHAHRSPVLDATRYVIEQLKQRVPIWKLEHYADGTRDWVSSGIGNSESGIGSASDHVVSSQMAGGALPEAER